MREETLEIEPRKYGRPTFHEPTGLWLYGNGALLRAEKAFVACIHGKGGWSEPELRCVDLMAESIVLEGTVLVCGVHGEGHRRAATVPIRWGSQRIVVLSGGFLCHLGEDLRDQPFREARLLRAEWDPGLDLAVSPRSPEEPPVFGCPNPSVDRLIARVAGPAGARFADGRPPERDPDPVRRYGRMPKVG